MHRSRFRGRTLRAGGARERGATGDREIAMPSYRAASLRDLLWRPVRMPRRRLTVAGIMAVIAALALGLGGLIHWERAREYRRRAAHYQALEESWRRVERFQQEQARLIREDRAGHREEVATGTAVLTVAQYEEWLAQHEAAAREAGERAEQAGWLKARYRVVARYPWLSVTPDPPPP